MVTLRDLQEGIGEFGCFGYFGVVGWLVSWWYVIYVGVLVFVLVMLLFIYICSSCVALVRQIVLGTMLLLLWFLFFAVLVSVVIICIVIVIVVSYGLTQYVLEMVVCVLVLELISFIAVLFVALRVIVLVGGELTVMHASGALHAQEQVGVDLLCYELLLCVVAGMFAVLLLVVVSCLIAMLFIYVVVYGFSIGAFVGFTCILGQIFEFGLAMVLVLKMLFFSLVVVLILVAVFLCGPQLAVAFGARFSCELDSLVRLFTAILVIEGLFLMSNYF